MHYRANVEKYVEVLTQSIDKENPPKYILLYEIRSRETLMRILDMFPNSKFYIVDEPYFIRLILKWPKKNYSEKILGYEMIQTEEDTKMDQLKTGLDAILEKAGVNNLTVIMNPPYGTGCSISRKVVNEVLNSKIIDEVICLAPKKSNYDHWEDLAEIEGPYGLIEMFRPDAGNDLDLYISHYTKKSKGTFMKSKAEAFLNKKQLQYYKAVEQYNKKHKNIFTFLQALQFNKKEEYSKYKENLIFEISQYTPANGVGLKGDPYEHNKLMKPIRWKPSCAEPWGVFCNTDQEFNNFSDWFYANPYGYSRRRKKIECVMDLSLSILSILYGNDPSILKYEEVWPNLDWTRSWNDSEILKELGLPENFIKG